MKSVRGETDFERGARDKTWPPRKYVVPIKSFSLGYGDGLGKLRKLPNGTYQLETVVPINYAIQK